jgi:hypothetical protein
METEKSITKNKGSSVSYIIVYGRIHFREQKGKDFTG